MIAQKGSALRGAALRVSGVTIADGRRYAIKFNGINQRGALAARAIDPNGDIDIRFKTGPDVPSAPPVSLGIVAQSASGPLSSWEVVLRVANPSGNWQLIVGGVTSISSGEPIQANKSYRVTLVGTALTYYKDGEIIAAGALTRGAAREPTAQTVIATRGTGPSTFAGYYAGQLYDVEINGTIWTMGDRGATSQASSPIGNDMTLNAVTLDAWGPI